ncbi:transmembrane protein 115-like [Littorina saxatilis]|uniref:Transmembrane protein 115 n=1 Tax=Littorina saxatilis TaxID=31220 RepID=A0AAN9GD00_9CAEN
MAAPMPNSKMHFMKEQMSAAVGNSSVVVKMIACAVVIGYLLSFVTSAIPFMTVTPGYVMPPNARVYSFFMYCFVELHFWHVITDIAVVVLCGKLLEPLWGAPDMLIFFVVVNLGVGFVTALLYIVTYLVTLNEDYLFDVHIYGMAGYIAGFCVAVKQVMPDHCVANMPIGKMRNTHIPLALLLITILLKMLGALPGHYPCMFGSGILISWIYLRFYQKHSNGNRGDMGDNFSFASFFPNQLQPMIAILSNTVFNFLIRVKVCKKPQRRYDVSSPTTITVTLPGTEPHDAERRKQLALKALNDRLNKGDTAPAWPSMDDDAPASPTTPTSQDTPTSISIQTTSSPPTAPMPAMPAKLPLPEFKDPSRKEGGGGT